MDDTTIRPVMIGIGDSEPRDTLLRYAASLALAEHRGLRFVHAVHPRAGAAGPSNVLIGLDAADHVGEQLVHYAAERTRNSWVIRCPSTRCRVAAPGSTYCSSKPAMPTPFCWSVAVCRGSSESPWAPPPAASPVVRAFR